MGGRGSIIILLICSFVVQLFYFCILGLEAEFEDLMGDALTKKSSKLYERYFNDYLKFCEEMSLPVGGTQSATSVELWVASLAKKGLGYGTVQSHLTAVRHMFRRNGIDITWESERLAVALKGLKKRKQPSAGKVAVSLSQIMVLHQSAEVSLPSYTCQMFKVIISLAFFGFLRPSEFCKTEEDHYLRRGDVKISESKKCCHLRLRSFKHSEKPAIIRISNSWSKSLCFVEALHDYMERHAQKLDTDPLFDITVSAFRSMLNKVCNASGIKVKITPHCFRHGGATWASKKGWSVARIKAHGRWKSQAYNTYISA